MTIQFVTIIGLGLIGGSLGLTIHKTHPTIKIAGFDVDTSVMDHGIKIGAIDNISSNIADWLSSDLLVLSSPISTIGQRLLTISRHTLLNQKLIITDTGSTKVAICSTAHRLHLDPLFVGSHPMAGKEVFGITNADSNLFTGAKWCVINNHSNIDKHRILCDFIRSLGAEPISLSAAKHDQVVALISHLPIILASSLVNTSFAHSNTCRTTRNLASSGFRDTSRVASGDVAMALDIIKSNKSQILSSVKLFQNNLQALTGAIATDNTDQLTTLLTQAKSARDTWVKHRYN